MRCFALLGLALAAAPLSAQQFVNGDFETADFSGWTVGLTSSGATLVQQVVPFDVDGPGPLGTSLSAQFSAGRATAASPGEQGVTLMQTLSLTGGITYTFDFDWAATRTITNANSQGGIFALMVDTTEITRQAAGSTSSTTPHFGHITANFTPSASGDFSVGVWILRPFTIPSPANLFQNVDNFVVTAPVPEPSFLAVVPLIAILARRRRNAA